MRKIKENSYNNFMKKIILCVFFIYSCDSSNPPVKKSRTDICHELGSKYYSQTKYFKIYKTIKDCIKSGGRLPKRG